MVNLNLTTFPIFFGCNDTSGPLILYLPNAPWSTFSNYSYMQSSFSDNQFDLMANNSFNLVTYGNGSFSDGEGWPACLAGGVIKRSLSRVGMALPDVCTKCFQRFCWNGEVDDAIVTDAEENHRPILNPNLSWSQWNQTWWSS
jgi:lysophospholipase